MATQHGGLGPGKHHATIVLTGSGVVATVLCLRRDHGKGAVVLTEQATAITAYRDMMALWLMPQPEQDRGNKLLFKRWCITTFSKQCDPAPEQPFAREIDSSVPGYNCVRFLSFFFWVVGGSGVMLRRLFTLSQLTAEVFKIRTSRIHLQTLYNV
jgi:hypothetical protein